MDKILFFKIFLILGGFFLIECKDNSTNVVLNNKKQIISFEIESHFLVGKIDEESKTVHLKITPDIDRTNLTPTIKISAGASISPKSGVAQDFSDTLTFTVRAQDGSSVNYKVYSIVGNYILNSCYHIVHMQKHFINNVGIHNSNQVASAIKQILDSARAEEIPVVFSKSQPAGDREIIDQLKPKSNEIVIESSSDDPIIDAINKLNVKIVVVAGIYTDACVKDICLKLKQEGFNVILVIDATSVSVDKNLNLIESTCQELEQNGIVAFRIANDVLF